MRKMNYLFLIAMLFIATSCSDEPAGFIAGKWRLVQANLYTLVGQSSVDYVGITYDFKLDGTLEVTGGDNLGYDAGTYNYVIEEDDNTNTDIQVQYMVINGTKWIYTNNGLEISLSRAYVDGSELIFKK